MLRRLTLLTVCAAVLSAAAWASDVPVASTFNPNEMILTPSRVEYISSLDDPQPDTLAYDNGGIQSFYSTANHWARVRFTAPNNFQVRSIYFVGNNPANNAAPCSVFVHANNAGNLGAVLSGHRMTPVVHFANFSNPTWNDTNLPTPVTIAAGQDFFIVLGPAPGGVQSAGWHVLLDAGATDNRSGFGTSHYGTYTLTTGDWMVRVGGAAEAFTDLQGVECWNANTAGDPKYQVLSGTDLTFHGSVRNIGNTAADLFTVRWVVRGPNGSTVFTNEVTGGPLARNQVGSYTASAPYSVMTTGEYMVSCIVDIDNDAIAANDTSKLRFFCGPLGRWFRYDDNQNADGYTSFTPGNGWGVWFEPVSYTAAVESLRFNVGGAGATDIAIWTCDAEGVPTTSVWANSPTMAQGWNTVAVNPPVLLFGGESFAVAFLYTSVSLGQDGNQPNAGDQAHMGTVSWQFEGTAWGEDNSGNWCIQAFIDSSSAQPPYPVLETSLDTLDFGAVDTTGNTTATVHLVIYNRGSLNPLNVTQMVINPPSIRSVFTVTPATLAVPAQDSAIVAVAFNPSAVRLYNGLLTITNNSNNEPAKNIIIRAEGSPLGIVEIPGGIPMEYRLAQNFPNPFNPVTAIEFSLPVTTQARLTVYNMLGQEVGVLVNTLLTAGSYMYTFDAASLPAGIYFYRLEAGSFSDIRKMMLLK